MRICGKRVGGLPFSGSSGSGGNQRERTHANNNPNATAANAMEAALSVTAMATTIAIPILGHTETRCAAELAIASSFEQISACKAGVL